VDARVEDILPAFFGVDGGALRLDVPFPCGAESAGEIMLLKDRDFESAFGEQGGGRESADA